MDCDLSHSPEYFNNFPEFYKWLVLGIFGSIYGLKPGMDLIRKK